MNLISQNQSKSFAFSKEKRYICIRIYVCKHVDGNIRYTRLQLCRDFGKLGNIGHRFTFMQVKYPSIFKW